MHGNRATYVTQCDAHHARLGVQHRHPLPCTAAVQLTLHPRGCNTGQPFYGLPIPSCTGVQDGRIPLPRPDNGVTQIGDFSSNPLTAGAERGNRQRMDQGAHHGDSGREGQDPPADRRMRTVRRRRMALGPRRQRRRHTRQMPARHSRARVAASQGPPGRPMNHPNTSRARNTTPPRGTTKTGCSTWVHPRERPPRATSSNTPQRVCGCECFRVDRTGRRPRKVEGGTRPDPRGTRQVFLERPKIVTARRLSKLGRQRRQTREDLT